MTATQEKALINKQGQLLVQMPAGTGEGQYGVIIVLLPQTTPQPKKHLRQIFSNHRLAVGGHTFSRADIYGEIIKIGAANNTVKNTKAINMIYLFTIICEYKGGTYTRQFQAASPQAAFVVWAKQFQQEGILTETEQ